MPCPTTAGLPRPDRADEREKVAMELADKLMIGEIVFIIAWLAVLHYVL